VPGYLRYECNPVSVERAHNIVAQFRNYRALFIFQRSDFVGGGVFEVNCDDMASLTSSSGYSSRSSSILRFFGSSPLKLFATALNETFSVPE